MRGVWDAVLLLLAAGAVALAGKSAWDGHVATGALVAATAVLDARLSAAAVGPLVAALPPLAIERECLIEHG
jgi:phage gp36-like protein